MYLLQGRPIGQWQSRVKRLVQEMVITDVNEYRLMLAKSRVSKAININNEELKLTQQIKMINGLI